MIGLSHKKPRLRLPQLYLDIVRNPERKTVGFPLASTAGFYYFEDDRCRDYEQAYLWFAKGAALEDSQCMYGLGQMSLYGEYVKQDDITALYWLHKAAELKDLDAIELLFDIHFDKNYCLYDLEAAHRWAIHADEIAAGKSPTFKVLLGEVWFEKKDYKQALHFFLEADNLGGGAKAAYYLGQVYQKNYDVIYDSSGEQKAIFYLMKAAKAGHRGATMRLRGYLKLERSYP